MDLAEQLSRRVIDLKKNLSGANHELQMLTKMTNDLAEVRMFKSSEAVAVHTKRILNASGSAERTTKALELV